jgi:hypothetical protein
MQLRKSSQGSERRGFLNEAGFDRNVSFFDEGFAGLRREVVD